MRASIKVESRAYFKVLGGRLHELRKQQQFTQAEIARMLGVSQQTVFAYELGDRRVPVDLLAVLARTFKVSADELLGIKPMRSQSKPSVPGRLTPMATSTSSTCGQVNFPHLTRL